MSYYQRPLPWRYIVDDEIGAVTILDAENRYVASMKQTPPQGETDAKKIVEAVNGALKQSRRSLVFPNYDNTRRARAASAR